MGEFYNRGSAALPLALPGGKSASVPGKRSITLTPEEAACESVQRAVSAGTLIPPARVAEAAVAAPASGGFAPFVAPEPPAVEAPVEPAGRPSAAAPEPVEAPADPEDRPSRVSPERTSSKRRVG